MMVEAIYLYALDVVHQSSVFPDGKTRDECKKYNQGVRVKDAQHHHGDEEYASNGSDNQVL